MRTLVAYFSASGRTAAVAKELAAARGADLFEICPAEPYTEADLNWRDPQARCNREHADGGPVPLAGTVEQFEQYDMVLLGFPIWYGCAPEVVHTFCRALDWSGKRVAVFATSGGGGLGTTEEKLRPCLAGGELTGTRLCRSAAELADL